MDEERELKEIKEGLEKAAAEIARLTETIGRLREEIERRKVHRPSNGARQT